MRLVALALMCCSFTVNAAELNDVQAAHLYALAYGQAGLPLPDQAPVVRITSQPELRVLAGCSWCTVRAWHRHGVIYLDDQLDFADAHDASVLLHEYIHYFQWAARGDAGSCREWLERERQAFSIQIEVLSRAGVDPVPVRTAARQTKCRTP